MKKVLAFLLALFLSASAFAENPTAAANVNTHSDSAGWGVHKSVGSDWDGNTGNGILVTNASGGAAHATTITSIAAGVSMSVRVYGNNTTSTATSINGFPVWLFGTNGTTLDGGNGHIRADLYDGASLYSSSNPLPAYQAPATTIVPISLNATTGTATTAFYLTLTAMSSIFFDNPSAGTITVQISNTSTKPTNADGNRVMIQAGRQLKWNMQGGPLASGYNWIFWGNTNSVTCTAYLSY